MLCQYFHISIQAAMLKFLKRKSDSLIGDDVSSSKQSRPAINLDNIPTNIGLRPPIMSYHPNDRDRIRRAYLQMGPRQPHNHDFPEKKIWTAASAF